MHFPFSMPVVYMLDLDAGKDCQVMKCIQHEWSVSMPAILHYNGWRARGVCALESSSYFMIKMYQHLLSKSPRHFNHWSLMLTVFNGWLIWLAISYVSSLTLILHMLKQDHNLCLLYRIVGWRRFECIEIYGDTIQTCTSIHYITGVCHWELPV